MHTSDQIKVFISKFFYLSYFTLVVLSHFFNMSMHVAHVRAVSRDIIGCVNGGRLYYYKNDFYSLFLTSN